MRALIFGVTGQVATELGLRAPDDAEIVALGRDRVDLSDPAACARAIETAQSDLVINAAAYTNVDRAEDEEARATTINGAAPGAMARACAARGLPFLHVSTDYVFDGSGRTPWPVEAPTAPLGAYGRSKLAGERAVRAAGGTYGILRTSWVFSAHGGNFVKTMLRLAETRDALNIVADQVGGPTSAADIAAALWTMARAFHAGAGTSGIYHFSGAPDVSWADFARAIFARAGRSVAVTDIPTSGFPTPAQRPGNSRLDCAALETVFGISRPDWQIGLDRVIAKLAEDSI